MNSDPSDFCIYMCNNYDLKNKRILELCCGNGRDSYYISDKCKEIFAIDLATKPKDRGNLKFFQKDILSFFKEKTEEFDLTYCRFGMHSVNETIESEILKNSNEIFLEFRSDKDDSYVEDHYRRKINGNDFLKKMMDFGFEIVYYKESKGLAIFKNQDPIIIRVIAKRIKK